MPPKDTPLPGGGGRNKLSFVQRTDRADGRFELVYRMDVSLENLQVKKKGPSAFGGAPAPAAPSGALPTTDSDLPAADDALESGHISLKKPPAEPAEAPDLEGAAAPSSRGPGKTTRRRRLLPPRIKRVMPLLLQELDELEHYEEPVMRYGDERSTLVLPKIRLDRKKKAVHVVRGHGLAAFADLRRVLPRLVTFESNDMARYRRFAFEGARPDSIHVLTRVLETPYTFRLEDLSHYAAHGDLVLKTLERLDVSMQAYDLDAIVYCPSIDSNYPFKFLVCGDSDTDNFRTYKEGLKRIFEKVEPVDAFRDRVFGELKLGFEKFGPGCATPEFQEVELRLWKLLGEAGTRMGARVGDIVSQEKGQTIRSALEALHDLHAAIDACTHLPSVLAAFYRHHFDLPFGKLFESALAEIDAIGKGIDVSLAGARPKEIDALAELVSRIRKLPARSHLENVEAIDETLAAAYKGAPPPPARPQPEWVRRYDETIFSGARLFDARRFKKDKDEPSEEIAASELELGDIGDALSNLTPQE